MSIQFRVPDFCDSCTARDVEEALGIGIDESYMISSGRLVPRSEPLVHGCNYYIFPRVLGGKGGFGSMLRAIGAQIEKTTSREACRDLSGRRIRDVNNEKKLKEWVSKQADREREKQDREERRRAKRAKYLEDTPSKMNNPEYDTQYLEIMRKSEQAIQEGLTRMKEGGTTSRKRKAESTVTTGTLDKYDRWNMLGGITVTDSGSDSDDIDAGPSTSAYPEVSSTKPATIVEESSCKVAKIEASEVSCSSSDKHIDTTGLHETSDSSDKQTESSPGPCDTAEAVKTSETYQSQSSSCNGVVSSSVVESIDPIDLDQFSGLEGLQALGMDRLKADLMRRGLKCGGSLEERAQRLFSVKGLCDEDIPAKLLAKGKGQGKSSQKGK